MSVQSGDGLGTIETNIGITQSSSHPRRYPNSPTSSLLRLPTELILKIFEHAIESESGLLLILTSICRELREIGVTAPYLWSTVCLAIPLLGELFLERCNYDPHTLIVSRSTRERQHPHKNWDPRRETVWLRLEGCAFKNLRSLVFEGTPPEFERRAVPILQRASNISSLEFINTSIQGMRLPWNPSAPIPHLSTLHLRGVSTAWNSPLLRNLKHLEMDLGLFDPPPESPPIETFLAALTNCPDLESLELARARPEALDGHEGSRNTVVQLRKLQKFYLEYNDPLTVRYLLSHIEYPESARVKLAVAVGWDADISETIYKVLPSGDSDPLRYFRKNKILTIYLGDDTHTFSADHSTILCRNQFLHHPQALSQFTAKFLQVIGRDTLVLSVARWGIDLTKGTWEAIFRGLPRLERLSYQRYRNERSQDLVDPFILAFSHSSGGAPVFPQLQDLELPRELFTQKASAALLKQALAERIACGRRLRRLGLSDGWAEEADGLLSEQFRHLVDEIQ